MESLVRRDGYVIGGGAPQPPAGAQWVYDDRDGSIVTDDRDGSNVYDDGIFA